MSLSPNDKKRMLKAKELIKQGEFKRAYGMIEHIDNPTAQKWRGQLEIRIQDEDFGDPFSEESPQMAKSKPKPKHKVKKGRRRIYIGIGIVAAIVITLMAAVSSSYDDIVRESTALQYLPSVNSEAVNADGGQWQYDAEDRELFVGTSAFTSAADTLSTPTLTEYGARLTLFVIRCETDGYDAFLVAESSLQRTDNLIVVGTKFDDDEAQTLTLNPSQSRDGAFFRENDLPTLFSELSESAEMLVTMPTVSGLYRFSIYDVSGFRTAARQLEQDCGALPSAS